MPKFIKLKNYEGLRFIRQDLSNQLKFAFPECIFTMRMLERLTLNQYYTIIAEIPCILSRMPKRLKGL